MNTITYRGFPPVLHEYRRAMDETTEHVLVELPNGPAKITTDNKKERFKLEYAGDPVFQGSVILIRDGERMSLKDAHCRLFTVSKSDGWDVVTQSIRVAAVGALPGDVIVMRGHAIDPGGGSVIEMPVEICGSIYRQDQDWLLSAKSDVRISTMWEDVPVRRSRVDPVAASAEGTPAQSSRRGTPDAILVESGQAPAVATQAVIEAEGADVTLQFRPHYKKRHVGRK